MNKLITVLIWDRPIELSREGVVYVAIGNLEAGEVCLAEQKDGIWVTSRGGLPVDFEVLAYTDASFLLDLVDWLKEKA